MIEPAAKGHGMRLLVRAQPGARESRVRGERDGALRVAITQVAEQGKANTALIAFLSKRLGIARSRVELVSGARTVEKTFLVHDISETELRRRIGAIVG